MKSKLSKLGLMLGVCTLFPIMIHAQILEAVEEKDDMSFKISSAINEALPEFHLGVTMSGSSGLATIPTPDYNERNKFSISGKGFSTDYKVFVSGEKINNTKDEKIISVRYNPSPELELSVTDLHFKRSNGAGLKALEAKEDLVSGGVKYTAGNDGKNYCFGFNFAPMTSEKMNKLDIEQLENMRNIYFTFSEEVDNKLTGYVNLGTSFTKDQKIVIDPATTIKIDRKNIVYGGVGAEYQLASSISVFGEFKVGNYRDFEAYKDKSSRHRAHIGARFGSDNFQIEVMGMNITSDEPNLVLGGVLGF